MKTRIISAVVGVVMLIAALACPYMAVFAVAVAALAAIAVWELLHNTGYVKDRALLIGSMVFAAAEVLSVYRLHELRLHDYMPSPAVSLLWAAEEVLPYLLPLAYGLFVLLILLAHYTKTDAVAGGYGFFMTAYVTAGFTAIAALRVAQGTTAGCFWVLLTLIIPWMSDTGAYFVGTFIGRHKMTPVISPKKSWEGFFGGWAVSVGSTVLAGAIFQAVTGKEVLLWPLAVFALVLAPLSVCGDLLASVIKRQCGIKDYGNIMPGHGGVMDRFDSVLIIAPLLYFLVRLSAHIS